MNCRSLLPRGTNAVEIDENAKSFAHRGAIVLSGRKDLLARHVATVYNPNFNSFRTLSRSCL